MGVELRVEAGVKKLSTHYVPWCLSSHGLILGVCFNEFFRPLFLAHIVRTGGLTGFCASMAFVVSGSNPWI